MMNGDEERESNRRWMYGMIVGAIVMIVLVAVVMYMIFK
jgi:hypothetical protein